VNAPTIMTRAQHQERVVQLAHARDQLARIDQAEADQLARREAARPRLQAALAAVRAAEAELEAARREAATGDALGIGAARRRGDLQRDIAQLEAELADSPWADR
jgi:chromosome segregation ATPase